MRKHLIKYCAKNPLSVILTLLLFLPSISHSQSRSKSQINCDTLSAKDTSGQTIYIKNIRSKYTILYFWSADCPYCLNAQNDINRLAKLYDTKKIVFIGFCVDSNLNAWKDYVRSAQTPFLQLNDGQGLKSNKLNLLKITGTPTFVFLNKQKEVLDSALTEEELIKKINNLWK